MEARNREGASGHGPVFPELRRPPDTAQPPWTLPPLLRDGAGKAIGTRPEWRKACARLKREWEELIGLFPRRTPLRPEELSREESPGHTRILLRYRTDAGPPAEAYLLLPKAASEEGKGQAVLRKRPGIVVLHQTTDETINQPWGSPAARHAHRAAPRPEGLRVRGPAGTSCGARGPGGRSRPRTSSWPAAPGRRAWRR